MVELIHFNQNEFVQGDDLQERFGLRGRNMLQLAELKTPIAPGFLIDSETVQGGLKEKLTLEGLETAIKKIEKLTEKTFNAPQRPMLFKVVVSPSIQIGTISSVHTVGINDEVAQGFANFCGEDFAFQEYRFFMEKVAPRFLGKRSEDFKAIASANANASNKEVCAMYREQVVPDFPQNGYEQLRMVLSEMSEQYLADPMNEGIEAGLLIQMMVYGNYGDNSYNGSFYSRNIVSGEARLTGHFGHNEFDTLPEDATDINEIKPEFLEQLQGVATLLEEKFLDIRDIKFTIEESRLWMVEQNAVDAKSTQAEIRTLLDLTHKGLLDERKLVSSVPPGQLQDLLHPIINHETTTDMPEIVGGLAGSPGAAVGKVAFSTKALLSEFRRCSLAGLNTNLILCMPHTDAEDVEALELGQACIASVGGYASHAPVVSRSLRKPCLLNESIEFHDGYMVMGGQRINEYDVISMEVPTYTDPTVWVGEAQLISPDTEKNGLEDFVKEVAKISSEIQIFGLAESTSEVRMALRLGAEGIGNFPCDSLLMQPATLHHFREALLVADPDKRKAALDATAAGMRADVVEVLRLLQGKKIVFRLMEQPLVDFLPHAPREQEEFYAELSAKNPGFSVEDFQIRANQLRNINPMMGLRGSRVAISYPDLTDAQVRAVLGGALDYSNGGANPVDLDLLVPSIMGDAEMRFIRYGRNIESLTIDGIHGIGRKVAEGAGLEALPFNYRVGAAIELPAAALMAGHISKQSEFFSIDLNMLTQTTNGMSKDDINMFLPSYTQYDILQDNPFQILSVPVKELIGSTIHFGKLTRPDLKIGMSGDQASDPRNMDFALYAGLDFITCTPLGVPIAKLALAHKVISGDA